MGPSGIPGMHNAYQDAIAVFTASSQIYSGKIAGIGPRKSKGGIWRHTFKICSLNKH